MDNGGVKCGQSVEDGRGERERTNCFIKGGYSGVDVIQW